MRASNTNALSYVTQSPDFVFGPRVKRLLNCSPDRLKIIEPPVGG